MPWSFLATPPRRSPSPLEGRQDTRLITVAVGVRPDTAIFTVEGTAVASTRRRALRAWLDQPGVKAHYSDGRLQLKYSDMGIWFEIDGHTAPTILVPKSVKRLITMLRT